MYSHPHQIPLHPTSGVLCTASDSYDSILYPHHHEEYELSLILDGVHAVLLENSVLELPAGGLILLRSNEPHSRRMISQGRHVTLAFPTRVMDSLEEYLEDASFRASLNASRPLCARLHAAETEQLAQRIEKINLFCTTNAARARTEVRSLLADCWCRFFISPETENPERVPWLNRLIHEMSSPENIRRGLPAMLEAVPYSHEYLCREFRRLLDCTPTEYINSLRLDRAHALLERTSLSVADICYEVGFDSISYFYRLFRSKYAFSPARYRKMRFVARPNRPQEQKPDA